jgi:putative DNA methylase
MYKKKLIEVALPLAMINEAAASEKMMGAAPHPQNIHRWWARRPLAAARAALWASLVDDPSSNLEQFPTLDLQAIERARLFGILEKLVLWQSSNDEAVLDQARIEIRKSCGNDLPKIVDPFAGGGAIPMEATRLGLETYAGDLNPVPVLIQRAMFEIPLRFIGSTPVFPGLVEGQAFWERSQGLAKDVSEYGNWVLKEAKARIGHLYPEAKGSTASNSTPIAYVWARTVRSPDPSWGSDAPLVRSWILSKKKGRPIVWIEPIVNQDTRTIEYVVRSGGVPIAATVERGNGVCLATGTAIPGSYIKEEAVNGRMGQTLIAVVVDAKGGKKYLSPSDFEQPQKVNEVTDRISGSVPRNLTGGTAAIYGLDEWWKLFTDRQLLALSTFSDLIEEVRKKVIEDAKQLAADKRPLRDGGAGAVAYGDAIATYLSFLVSKCADFWSSLCTWNSNNEQIRNVFARQAIPMSWDFVETNPFSGKMGSWESMSHGLVGAIRECLSPPGGSIGKTQQRDAVARINEIGKCVVCTDPPYYDNISYADLSDFFYVWLRKSLKTIWTEEFATLLTPKAEELIANRHRAGSVVAANKFFESGMQEVFKAVALNADERFPSTVFYAFKASETEDKGNISTGWETFLTGVLDAGFSVTATWPMRTEMGNRMVASGTNALASSILLACRKRDVNAPMATRGEFISVLRSEMAPAIKILQDENIAPVDMAQSAIGPGIGIFSRYSKVLEADGKLMTVRTALSLINEVLAEVLSGEESEFDAETRFAVTWFEQYGYSVGVFGDAETLAKAKNTTVGGVVESGIASSKEGKLHLLDRSEISENWNPTDDARLTVWETTQHLIRALEESESEAAELLKKIGSGYGERARQLAYLLYGICDRKKWAAEGNAYNILVNAWPEIEKLSNKESIGESTSETLF